MAPAGEALLEQEKAHTRARGALAAKRRRMPMIRVERDYRFTAPGGGDATLLDLFDGSRQLVLYRFFMDPDMDVYPERGCPGCSMYADQLGNLLHLRERDTRFVARQPAASRSTCSAIASTWGWEFPWYTLRDDFDADHDVAEWHGDERVPARRRRGLPRVLHRRPWRRGARVDLELPRHISGLPRRLALRANLRRASLTMPARSSRSPASQAQAREAVRRRGGVRGQPEPIVDPERLERGLDPTDDGAFVVNETRGSRANRQRHASRQGQR